MGKRKNQKNHILLTAIDLKAIDKIVLNSKAKINGPRMMAISFVKFN